VHALHGNPSAYWGLVALGLAYGVFHAAAPGHGKSLVASYMMANERSLRLGAVMALATALLQALVAIGLVGAAGLLFNATASQMNRAADSMALASYCGVAAIGLWLVWRKGGALIAALKSSLYRRRALYAAPASADIAWNTPPPSLPSMAFCFAAPVVGGPGMHGSGCAHAPDPGEISCPISLRGSAGTVIAAGVRPCSGAILVLVFARAQELFAAGCAATFAMALGTAATTGALAFMAVFAKRAAMRFAAGEDSRLLLVARGVEFAAALVVLAFGVTLMFGARGGA
jgi:nickel/cobalt transporter (NicO) family protein